MDEILVNGVPVDYSDSAAVGRVALLFVLGLARKTGAVAAGWGRFPVLDPVTGEKVVIDIRPGKKPEPVAE